MHRPETKIESEVKILCNKPRFCLFIDASSIVGVTTASKGRMFVNAVDGRVPAKERPWRRRE
jgi:hypothetical protein